MPTYATNDLQASCGGADGGGANPLPDRLEAVLKAAKARQAAERLALGHDGGAWAYVVSNEVGEPYSPAVPSR